jgi:hypothetical protein
MFICMFLRSSVVCFVVGIGGEERQADTRGRIVQGLDRTLRRLDDRLWGVEDRLRISHVSVQGQGQGGSRRDGERFYDD